MAKTRVINTVLKLHDKMSPNIKRTAKETKNLERRIKKTQNTMTKFGKKTAKSMKKMTKNAMKLGAVGAGALVMVGKKSIEMANVQLENEKKLAVVLKQRTNATDKQINSILKLTAVQQKNGVVGDEVQIAGAQQLSTFVSQTESVETLIPAMNNLLVQQKGLNGTTSDAVNIGNLMGKVMQGQVGALSRVGITFSKAEEKVLKYGTEQEKAAMLAKVITNNVGEMNKELANTDAGKVQQAKNIFGDMQEEIGKKLLPEQAKFADWFVKKSPMIQKTVLKTTKTIIKYGKKAYKQIVKMINFIKKHQKTIKTVLKIILGFIVLVKIAGMIIVLVGSVMKVIKVVKTVVKVFQIVKKVMLAVNAVMMANPIILIIMGIVALIAIGVLLYKNWDTVKEKAKALWEGIKTAFAPVGEFFSGIWDGVKSGFKTFINFIIRGINDFTSKLSWIPEQLSKVPGFSWATNFIIPEIPEFAKGGIATQPSIFGEAGAEMAIPLKKNNPRSKELIGQADKIVNGNSKGKSVEINVHIDTFIGEDGFADTIGEKLVRKIKPAIANMA